jgi:hypothetical protein
MIPSLLPFYILKGIRSTYFIQPVYFFPLQCYNLLVTIAIIIHEAMAPRPHPRPCVLYWGKLESAEKLRDDSEKLAHFHVTNLIDWSMPQFRSQGTQTDDGWEIHFPHIQGE